MSLENNNMTATKHCHDEFGSVCTMKLHVREHCFEYQNDEFGQCEYPCGNFSTSSCKRIAREFQVPNSILLFYSALSMFVI